MLKALVRWGLFFIALLAAGPVAWLATGRLRAPDGGLDTTALLSTTPLLAAVLSVGVILLAGLIGIVTARLVNLHSALFNAGIVLTWAAFGTGTIDAIARATTTTGMGWRLVAEGAILAPVTILVGWLICRIAPPHHPLAHDPDDERSLLVQVVPTILAAVLAGFVASWLVAQNFLKGQTIAAAAIAGLLAATVGLVLDHRARPAATLAGLALMAVLGPLAGVIMHGSAFQPTAAIGLKLARFAGVLPMDWVAGAFLGTPLGLSLGGWIAEGRHPHPKPRTAAA